MGIVKKLVSKATVKYQLYTVYLLAVFIPVLVIGGSLVFNTRNLLYKQDLASLESDNLRVRSIMVDLTNLVYTVGNILMLDDELQNVIGTKYSSSAEAYEAYRQYKTFDNYKNNYTEIQRVDFYFETLTEYGSFKKLTNEIKEEDWYRRAIATPQPIWISKEALNSHNYMDCEFQFIQRVPMIKTGEFGVLVITVSNNHVKSRINNNILYNDVVVNQDLIFYSESGKKGDYLTLDIDYEEPYFQFSGVVQEDGKKILMQITTLRPVFSSDSIYILTSNPTAFQYIQEITMSYLLIIGFSIVVPLLLIMIFTHKFSNRVLTLRHVMHKVSIGDYGITETIRGNDELMDVFTDLKTMIESIKKMDEEIYMAKIMEEQLISHQQKIKYEMLASQINPHFLYNTLETIRMKAFQAEDREVANAIKLLGKAMRHVLDNSLKTVTLESELEYIRIYLQIQHIRFGERLQYEIEVSEEVDCSHYFILPLLLQPIVENAVSHGLETKTGIGHLNIVILYEDEMLSIYVKDNGSGMPEEELKILVERMKSENLSTGQNIGLHNIYQRIRLFYGEPYGVIITSLPNQGTSVCIRLPKTAGEPLNLNEALYNRVEIERNKHDIE